MIRAYKYKLNPTIKQRKALCQAFGNARFIYNWGLNRKIESWEKDKKNITFFQLSKELTLLKRDSDYKWLKNCANVCLQQALRNLENAHKGFFKNFEFFKTLLNFKFRFVGLFYEGCELVL